MSIPTFPCPPPPPPEVCVNFVPVRDWKFTELREDFSLSATQLRFDVWMLRIQHPDAYAICVHGEESGAL